MRPLRSAAAALAAGVTFASVLVGCGSSSKPAVCSDVDALQKSVQSLRDVQLDSGALTKIRDDLSTISTQFDTFKKDAKSEFSSDVANVRRAIDELSTNVATAKQSPTASNLAATGTAVKGVADATKKLADSVASTC